MISSLLVKIILKTFSNRTSESRDDEDIPFSKIRVRNPHKETAVRE